MEHEHFDRIARAMAAGVSRRSVLRRAAGSAMTSPLGLFGISAAAAQGNSNKDKDKGKEKDKGNQGNQGAPGNSGCRGEGHPCEGNQVCCAGLACPEAKGTTPPGNARRCTAASATSVETNQTVVNANNQVCAGTAPRRTSRRCWSRTGSALARPRAIGSTWRAPTMLPSTRRSAIASRLARPKRRRCARSRCRRPTSAPSSLRRSSGPRGRRAPATNEATGGEANAGTGGVANADASGGSVTVGDIEGDDANVAIDASGGTANADASGGDNNVAIAGGGQTGDNAAQAVELSTLTLTLEGNVAPGKLATYWVDTDAGRRPAQGPALVQVEDAPADTGTIIAEARTCPIAEPQPGYDWFGQCTAPAVEMQFSLTPASGDGSLPASLATNAQGRARFGELAAGTYQLQPEGTIWCYAESDRVDENGNILVEAGLESHVWSFVCGDRAGAEGRGSGVGRRRQDGKTASRESWVVGRES